MPPTDLHLVPQGPSPVTPEASACRVIGCAQLAGGALGFCPFCERRYEATTARRGRLAEAVCARLAAIGHPLGAVFSGRPRDFGAHVLAHLEELEAAEVHVPAAAVEDYLAELDAKARMSG